MASQKKPKTPTSLFPPKPAQSQFKKPGNPVKLITNLFKISIATKKPIYRHGVTVDVVETSKQDSKVGPRKLAKEIRVKVVRKAVSNWITNNRKDLRNVSYPYVLDGNASIIFASFNMLDSDAAQSRSSSLEIEVNVELDTIVEKKIKLVEKSFIVKLSDGAQLNVQDLLDYCHGKGTKDYSSLLDHIRALNTIMHGQVVTIPALIVSQSKSGVGSIFQFSEKQQFGISTGVFCNKGATLSVRATESGLALNVANTVAPFYESQPLLKFLVDRYRVNLQEGPTSRQIEAIIRDLKNKQVEVLHINYGTQKSPHYKKYRIHSISRNSSALEMFESKDKEGKAIKMSVAEYFKKEYPNFPLKYPKMPCIVDNGRMLPIEVCRIVEKQRVSEVIKHAALKPDRHFQQVFANVENVRKNTQSLTDFGLSLDCKPIEVEGRELPPVEIVSGGRGPVRAQGGQYDIRRDRFLVPAKVQKWAMLIIVDDYVAKDGKYLNGNANDFAKYYCSAGQSKGVAITQPGPLMFLPTKPPSTINKMPEAQAKQELVKLFSQANKDKYDFLMITLPNSPDWLYSYIQYAETHPDVRKTRSQGEKCTRSACVKYDNYKREILQDERGRQMFLANLWLKHNVKLGGVNVVLNQNQQFGIQGPRVNFLEEGYLFISIDVCHPAPGDKFMQSVAAMVGMWDLANNTLSHTTRLRVQAKQRSKNDLSTVEEVGEVGLMFKEILSTYIERKRKPPSKVVVLRDGVSEGQFKMVLQYELMKMRSELDKQCKGAKLSCMTVQKRHRVRFMREEPISSQRGDDYNIQPGTVVDSTVTHPNDFTFYLAPHKAIQGTSKAPYIYMIYDDIGFDMNSAQAMIHALSCLSPRCTKLTSIPTPINLADLAAERGKNIIIAWGSQQNDPKKIGQDELLAKLNAHLSSLGDANYKNTLYYI